MGELLIGEAFPETPNEALEQLKQLELSKNYRALSRA